MPKKGEDGQCTYRMVVDFRKLNEITEFENYPLPRIDEILDQLGNARYFTVMDLKAGYHQVPIKEEYQRKTGFSAFGKHYEFLKLAFGLQTAPQNFQKIMNDVLDELLIGNACYVYWTTLWSMERQRRSIMGILGRCSRGWERSG